MRKMKAKDLIIDEQLYPRNNVDPKHVTDLKMAIESGAKLPPIVADAKSKRVIDGVHRVKAYLRIDPEIEIDVILRKYASEAEMFLDAMRMNAGHGARLDTADWVHCTIIADRLSIPPEAVAGALHVPVDWLLMASEEAVQRLRKLHELLGWARLAPARRGFFFFQLPTSNF